MKHTLKNFLAVSLLSSAVSLALAQAPASPPAAEAMAGQRMAGMQQHMAQRHAKFLADLKTNLQLNPGQESAWTSFAAAMQPPADMMARHQAMRTQHAEMEKLTTPERIDKMRAQRNERMARMNTEMSRREDAAKSFYATLAPAQQKVFDAAHLRLMRAHGAKRGMGAHGHPAHN